jgi:hypothetical protein
MMTNWRERCAELLQALETEGYAHWTVTPDKDELCLRTRAELAQPEPEGPPAVTTSALLHPAYEPDDGSADGAQMVGMAWWRPAMGCDSLQLVVDNARNILRSRWGRPAIKPELGEGEVEELVRRLRDWHSIPLLEERERIATLLQQLYPLSQPRI